MVPGYSCGAIAASVRRGQSHPEIRNDLAVLSVQNRIEKHCLASRSTAASLRVDREPESTRANSYPTPRPQTCRPRALWFPLCPIRRNPKATFPCRNVLANCSPHFLEATPCGLTRWQALAATQDGCKSRH